MSDKENVPIVSSTVDHSNIRGASVPHEQNATSFLRRSTDQMKHSTSLIWNMFGVMACFWLVLILTSMAAFFAGRQSAMADVKVIVEPKISIPPAKLSFDMPKYPPSQPIFYIMQENKNKDKNKVSNKIEEPKAITIDPPPVRIDPVRIDPVRIDPVRIDPVRIKPKMKQTRSTKETPPIKLDAFGLPKGGEILPPPKGISQNSETHAESVWFEAEKLFAKKQWTQANKLYLYFEKDHGKSKIFLKNKILMKERISSIAKRLK